MDYGQPSIVYERMQFRDIPEGKWFRDGSGRRMLKLRTLNGADFPVFYQVHSVPAGESFECMQTWQLEEVYTHENTGCKDTFRNHPVVDIAGPPQRSRAKGFNAIDEDGAVCCCPLDVEFFVEKKW